MPGLPSVRVPGWVAGFEHLPSRAPLLRYSTTHVVGIGLEGSPPEKLQNQVG